MWIHVDLTKHTSIPATPPDIVQVASSPDEGSGHITNGKFVIPTPLDLDFRVDERSYVFNALGQIDGGDVSSQAFSLLLARFPQYEYIYFNPLLTADNVGELVEDQSFYWTDGEAAGHQFYPRFQTGRSGMVDQGQMPTATAILPVNTAYDYDLPGLILTEEIDISDYTKDCEGTPQGASQFMVYWKILEVSVTHDEAGAVLGVAKDNNAPALRYVGPADDEPSDFAVYLTTDGGVTWCEVGLLEPVSMCETGTSFRLAFVNYSTDKLYLAHFAVMFRADL